MGNFLLREYSKTYSPCVGLGLNLEILDDLVEIVLVQGLLGLLDLLVQVLGEQLRDLHEAGFLDVEARLKFFNLALLLSLKQYMADGGTGNENRADDDQLSGSGLDGV